MRRLFPLLILLPALAPGAQKTKPDPGRVTARRLNRAEYNYSVHDLLGIDFQPAADFPADDSGYGFDNIGDVLSLSPLLMEHYLDAAEDAARAAVFGPRAIHPTTVRYANSRRAARLAPSEGYDATGLSLPSSLHVRLQFPATGQYRLTVVLGGEDPASQPLHIGVWIDGRLITKGETPPGDFEIRPVPIPAAIMPEGEHTLSVSFLNAQDGLAHDQFLTAHAGAVDVGGPFDAARGPSPESAKLVYSCGHLDGNHMPACARTIVGNLARRAFRRPVSDAETERLLALAAVARQKGGSFEDGIAAAIEGILVSPHFLFRIERENAKTKSGAQLLSTFDLASRLSAFLWSSIPDEDLLHAAEDGSLRKPQVLASQVRRMLADPKRSRLVENFAGQWLETRRLESVKPDAQNFPQFDEYLRYSMRRESDLFFENLIREDRGVADFIDAKYAFINERLARFYGIPNVNGAAFRKVDLTGTARGGILTEAAVLTVSSYANRTSPVLRGKWILNNLLNMPPPPPPPGVANLDEAAVGKSISMRQQMEKHRASVACAGCHATMDPLGFGLENFNAIGQWRARDGEFPIDASGKLPDGRTFDGATQLEAVLLAKPQVFAMCFTEKLLTYALGRGLEAYDAPAVERIVSRAAESEYRFSSIVLGIVSGVPFQMRKSEKSGHVSKP